jgi:DeoR family suf operon transcriptional repressor
MSTPTRETILRTMRTRGKCTVNALAEAAEVSSVSVRHHLANLMAEGLIAMEEVRHGVGRPRQLYWLTESGLDLSPGRYFRLTNRLLDEIKGSLTETQVGRLFSGVASGMADRYAEALAGMSLPEKLNRLKTMLADEGFEAEMEAQEDRIVIREMNCPYFRIGREHPEVCQIDQAFIATALALPVSRVGCVLDGDAHCTFTVPLEVDASETGHHDG